MDKISMATFFSFYFRYDARKQLMNNKGKINKRYLLQQTVTPRNPHQKEVECCDQKLASDSSGLSGGFSGQRAWVRKWAPGSFCEQVVKLVQLPGQVLSILLYVGDKTNEKSNSLGIK
jgi:hypothetical protein